MLSRLFLEFTKDMLKICRAQFPRTCGTCGRNYPSFKDYVETVEPLDVPKIDHIEDEDPIGLMSFGNCPCGSTMVIRCEDLDGDAADKHRRFNEALRQEEITTGHSVRDILHELRRLLRVAAVHEE